MCLVGDVLDDAGGYSSHHGAGRYVLCHYGTGRHDGIVADGYTGEDGGVRPHPDAAPQDDWGRQGDVPPLGGEFVVEGGEHDVVSYLATVAQRHSAVVLEVAAGVDEHVAAHGDVLAEVRVEGREHAERVGHLVAEELGEQPAYFVGRMVGRVQLEGDAPCFVAHVVHEPSDVFGVQRAARLYKFFEIFDSHDSVRFDIRCKDSVAGGWEDNPDAGFLYPFYGFRQGRRWRGAPKSLSLPSY